MKRFNITQRGYKYDKIIFNSFILIIIVYAFLIFAGENFDMTPKAYFNCLEVECKNPYYGMDLRQQLTILFFVPLYTTPDCSEREGYEWIKEERLPFGEYGELPPQNFFIKHIRIVVVAALILTFLLNHFIHNKGKTIDVEIPITKKIIINRDWIKKKLK